MKENKPKTFPQIKKELAAKQIFVIRVRATLNGHQCYQLRGAALNTAALWTVKDIRLAYLTGHFV